MFFRDRLNPRNALASHEQRGEPGFGSCFLASPSYQPWVRRAAFGSGFPLTSAIAGLIGHIRSQSISKRKKAIPDKPDVAVG